MTRIPEALMAIGLGLAAIWLAIKMTIRPVSRWRKGWLFKGL